MKDRIAEAAHSLIAIVKAQRDMLEAGMFTDEESDWSESRALAAFGELEAAYEDKYGPVPRACVADGNWGPLQSAQEDQADVE